MPKPISAEDFVRIWQGAENVDQVMQETGLARDTCYGRAWRLRKRGVPLRFHEREPPGPLDIEKLSKIAVASAKG